MKVGTAQLDITPEPGIDLAGFALRSQPSTGILDPLSVRALYLQDGREQLLWLHADLLALEQALADRLRQSIGSELAVPASRVLLSTTHTHSGPAAIQLTSCGKVSSKYVARLEREVKAAARQALLDAEPCALLAVQGSCSLGVDRRNSASAHTDPRVGALGWQRQDGSFKAVFVDYAMHPVCLRGSLISADWPGEVANRVSDGLPGRPVTLVSSGASGNINPPAVDVAPRQMLQWGRAVAEAVLPQLNAAGKAAASRDGRLNVANAVIELPVEAWNTTEIDKYAAACLADASGHDEFGQSFARAVEVWRRHMTERLQRGEPAHTQAELTAIRFDQTVLLAVNAEVFSRFTELAATGVRRSVYTAGCANGMLGYLPTAEAYDEGTYEVLWAMLFYNMPRPRKGGLELLAERARRLIAGLSSRPNAGAT